MIERSPYVILLHKIRELYDVKVNCYHHQSQPTVTIGVDNKFEYRVVLSVEIKIAGNWFGQYRVLGTVTDDDRYTGTEYAKYIALQTAIIEIEIASGQTIMN